jgi:hypothetical protein
LKRASSRSAQAIRKAASNRPENGGKARPADKLEIAPTIFHLIFDCSVESAVICAFPLIYQFSGAKSESALDSHFLRAAANFSTSRRIKTPNIESRRTFCSLDFAGLSAKIAVCSPVNNLISNLQ